MVLATIHRMVSLQLAGAQQEMRNRLVRSISHSPPIAPTASGIWGNIVSRGLSREAMGRRCQC